MGARLQGEGHGKGGREFKGKREAKGVREKRREKRKGKKLRRAKRGAARDYFTGPEKVDFAFWGISDMPIDAAR